MKIEFGNFTGNAFRVVMEIEVGEIDYSVTRGRGPLSLCLQRFLDENLVVQRSTSIPSSEGVIIDGVESRSDLKSRILEWGEFKNFLVRGV